MVNAFKDYGPLNDFSAFYDLNAFNGLVSGPWIRSHTSGVRDATQRASAKAELGGKQGPAGGEAASAGGEAISATWLLLRLLGYCRSCLATAEAASEAMNAYKCFNCVQRCLIVSS